MPSELFLVVVMVAEGALEPPEVNVLVAPIAPEPLLPVVSVPENVEATAVTCGNTVLVIVITSLDS